VPLLIIGSEFCDVCVSLSPWDDLDVCFLFLKISINDNCPSVFLFFFFKFCSFLFSDAYVYNLHFL